MDEPADDFSRLLTYFAVLPSKVAQASQSVCCLPRFTNRTSISSERHWWTRGETLRRLMHHYCCAAGRFWLGDRVSIEATVSGIFLIPLANGEYNDAGDWSLPTWWTWPIVLNETTTMHRIGQAVRSDLRLVLKLASEPQRPHCLFLGNTDNK